MIMHFFVFGELKWQGVYIVGIKRELDHSLLY